MLKNKLVLIITIVIGLNSCTSTDTVKNIPIGQYTLSGGRGLRALLCGMSETTFGKTINITAENGGTIETQPLGGMETVKYIIEKVGDTDYTTTVLRPVENNTITINFSLNATNKQLLFSCDGEKIIYQGTQ